MIMCNMFVALISCQYVNLIEIDKGQICSYCLMAKVPLTFLYTALVFTWKDYGDFCNRFSNIASFFLHW
jgi:hypothetical protein